MDHYLDEILNKGQVGIKRRTNIDRNNEIVKKNGEKEKKKGVEESNRKESESGQNELKNEDENQQIQHEKEGQSSYEVQQITEQIVFDEYQIQNHSKPQSLKPKVHEFAPEILSSHHQSSSQAIQVFSPSYYNQNHIYIQDNQLPLSENQIEENQPMIMSAEQLNHQPESPTINFRTLENLINCLNLAKQAQVQLIGSFQLEKQSFTEFMNLAIAKIQIEIKNVLEKEYKNKRVEFEAEIRHQLQAEYLTKQSAVIPCQQSNNHLSSLSNQRRWQIQKKLIKQQLQQRYQYRLQKLQQQLQQQRNYSYQLIRTYQQTHDPSHDGNKISENSQLVFKQNGDVMKNNDEIGEELEFVRRQLIERERMISEMEMEIQKLNQHIFDVEQKLQGIQLEIENRVRERVKQIEQNHTAQSSNTSRTPVQSSPVHQLHPILQSFSHLEQSSRFLSLQSTHPSTLQQVQLQNQHLKRYIQTLEQEKLSIELQLKEQEKIITFREEQVKKNQEEIAYEWAEIDRERQALLNREQQLVTAEENISRKISQLRNKQIDLDKWETELQKRQVALDIREQEINQKLQEIVQKQNYSKQFLVKQERQTISNLSSNNNHLLSRKNIQDFNTEGGGSFRPNGIEIPELPIGKRYTNLDTYESIPVVKNQKSFQYEYYPKRNHQLGHNHQGSNFSGKPHDLILKGNLQKSFEEVDRSYTRQHPSRQRMIITQTNFRTNRPISNAHQYVLPQTSKAQQRQSRSKSKEKSMLRYQLANGSSVSGYGKNPSSINKGKYIEEYYQNRQSSNLDGLGSKLERLRDEIKREIDSIK